MLCRVIWRMECSLKIQILVISSLVLVWARVTIFKFFAVFMVQQDPACG
jgi:hypothetical protein